jgi:hypothetical protein
MNLARPIRRALGAVLPASTSRRQPLVVQPLGFDGPDLDTLPAVLDEVGRALGVELRLGGVDGDLVLAEQGFVERVAPQLLQAFLEDRPLLTVAPPADAGDAVRRGRQLHAELVRQWLDLTGGAGKAAGGTIASTLPPSGFDSSFDSRQQTEQLAGSELDPDRAGMLDRLRCGLADPTQAPLTAGYGRRASLRIDFAAGVVQLDELADQRLRLSRELPYLSDGALPEAGAKSRDLDLVAWDIALAAGHFRLLHSPVNWWHTPLVVLPRVDVARYTKLPQHLAMARTMAQGPIAPADLRRRCRVSLSDLRGFLQAALFLGVIHWLPGDRR